MPPRTESRPAGEGMDEAAAAWLAMSDFVTEGNSWSGRERNVCYLNEGTGRFTDVSAVSGLDLLDDGRGLALVDWDGDGDLDLWFRNRTAPRLRLMLNQGGPGRNASVALRLRSRTGNRDGIGGVVELSVTRHTGERDGARLIRSVRAGDLFLSQSTKWLHFGLGDRGRIRSISARVRWPGGVEESFAGLEAGGRFVLEQGRGVARPWEEGRRRSAAGALVVESEPLPVNPVGGGSARILLPVKVPLPEVSYRDSAAQARLVSGSSARLLMIWTASCPHCERELESMARGGDPELFEVLALSIDGLERMGDQDGVSAAYQMMDQVRPDFAWGFVDGDSLERIRRFQLALFDKAVPFTVPLSLLLDSGGNVRAIYRGPVGRETVEADARTVADASAEEMDLLAPPMAGRTLTNPVGDEFIAEFMARRLEDRDPDTALKYLKRAAELSAGERGVMLRREIGARHHVLARRYAAADQPAKAVVHFERALAHGTGSAEFHHDFGVLLFRLGRYAEAAERFEAALELKPDSEVTRRALELARRAGGGEPSP